MACTRLQVRAAAIFVVIFQNLTVYRLDGNVAVKICVSRANHDTSREFRMMRAPASLLKNKPARKNSANSLENSTSVVPMVFFVVLFWKLSDPEY